MVQLANGNFRVKYTNFSQHGKIVHLALSAGNKMTPVTSGGNRITKSCFKKFKLARHKPLLFSCKQMYSTREPAIKETRILLDLAISTTSLLISLIYIVTWVTVHNCDRHEETRILTDLLFSSSSVRWTFNNGRTYTKSVYMEKYGFMLWFRTKFSAYSNTERFKKHQLKLPEP